MITFKENMQRVLRREEPAYMPLLEDYDTASLDAMDFVNERPNIPGVNEDWFGQSWTYESGSGAANPTPGVHLVNDITKWREQVTFPDVSKLDWATRAKNDTASWQRDTRMSRITVGIGIWERMFSVVEFQDALVSLLVEPEACYEFFGAMADHKIRLHDKILDHYKPDIINMHDDYGNSKGLFMSPEVWRDLIKPHLKRIVDHVQSRGCIYEHHNCGYFAPITEDMLELGIKITNPLHRSNDIAFMKKEYGSRMVFVGAFEVQSLSAPTASEADIRASVRKTMDIMAPGGGFIPNFKGLNANIVNDEIMKYGAKFYGPRPE